MSESHYPIRAVAKLVGMTTDSIRAWERRYGAITPSRSRGGRLYSDTDVQRLRLLKRAVDHGHSIGRIATLENQKLEALPLEDGLENDRTRHVKRMEQRQISEVLNYLDEYDFLSADRTLGSLAALQSPREFVYTLVLPLMREVGQAWSTGRFCVAQEHMLSSIMRNLLGTMIRLNSRESSKVKLLFTTLPEERHEFGVLSAAMITAGAGLRAIYLGPDLPVDDMVAAAEKTRADAIVLAMVPDEDHNTRQIAHLRDLATRLPQHTDVVIGGALTESVSNECEELGFHWIKQMDGFEKFLEKKGGRF